MDLNRRLSRRFWLRSAPMLVLLALLLYSLHRFTGLLENRSDPDPAGLYLWLLIIYAIGMVVLIGVIARNLAGLIRLRRQRAPGARFSSRLTGLFVTLAVLPLLVMFYFSVQFLDRSIDSWFNVEIDQAMTDSLELSRDALDLYMRERLRSLRDSRASIFFDSPSTAGALLHELREEQGALELTLTGPSGEILATSSVNSDRLLPTTLAHEARYLVRQGQSYVGLLDDANTLRVQLATPLSNNVILQGLFDLPEHIRQRSSAVREAYQRYRELSYLRESLQFSFSLALVLVLLLAILGAAWAALYAARRMVEPLRELADGTLAVAEGDFTAQISETAHGDELGFLVRSFNAMTQRLHRVHESEQRSRQDLVEQQTYQKALLSALSSGVVSFGQGRELMSYNKAAEEILLVDLSEAAGAPLSRLAERYPHVRDWCSAISRHLDDSSRDWRDEINIQTPDGQRLLLCHGSPLRDADWQITGQVMVMDDITGTVQAQRDAAWSEAARRMAHEIKNPLTPIQLSAERLQRQASKHGDSELTGIVNSAAATIVQQVEAMKRLVNEFSDYARVAQLSARPVDLNQLIEQVTALYQGTKQNAAIQLDLEKNLPVISCDPDRMRQVLHNLLKNALEAHMGLDGGEIHIRTFRSNKPPRERIQVRVEDNGAGFSTDVLPTLFEPYVTTKPKGTGLGMAIVKKIIQEHNGRVWAENLPEGGARVGFSLPVNPGLSETEPNANTSSAA